MQILKFVILLSLFTAGILYGNEFTFFKEGKPQATIVRYLNKKVASGVEFFNDAVYRCTGHTFPIEAVPDKNTNNIIFNIVKRPLERSDEYTIDFPDKKTLRITGTDEAVTAAFNLILENYFNCRFLFPVGATPYKEDINHYPSSRNVAMPRKTIRKKASFNLKRQVDWRAIGWQKRWNFKHKLHTAHLISYYAFPVYKYAVDQSWPKNILPTLENGKKIVLPKAKAPLSKNHYIATHNYQGWNPCFSHPDTTRIAIENILEFLKKNPKEEYICLAVNDNGNMCKCAACLKAVKGKVTNTGHTDYSQIYWKWVNDIANAVTEKYPHIYITALAYREVLEAPDFRLNKKVLPMLCFEITTLEYPDAYAKRIKFLERWKKAAHQLDVWDYSSGISHYLLPRVYFKTHAKWLRILHKKYNVRAAFIECTVQFPFEGPRHYLMSKMLYDIDADPEKIIHDWILHAVGKKSAPYLRKYYDFWEKYWMGKEIRKTAWFTSRFGTYMSLGDIPHHALALQKGDMKKLRALMEKVVAYAGTPGEKRRAKVLMDMFELSECAAKALFAEIFQPNATLASREDALLLLKEIPAAVKAYNKLQKNPFLKAFGSSRQIPMAQLGNIERLRPFFRYPEIKKEAAKIANNKELPIAIRGLLKIWLGAKAKNLIPNGSFEKSGPLPHVLWNEGGAYRSARKASHGDYGFRVPPFCCYAYYVKVRPEKLYLFMFDAYIKKNSIEGNLNFELTPLYKKRIMGHIHYLNNKLVGGQWVTLSGVGRVGKRESNAIDKDYELRLMFYLRKFEEEDEIYIDNVRAYCLDDLQ